ncbi:MAG: DNA/RNA nuclease SfsA [Myxococcales bacterium]|nr:DNA/RNA nuclease SfsA [Myxococcales bacterium]USN49992.1 MAG: DNA/RNA nuclease SfsA [Myxococcales bacterium]
MNFSKPAMVGKLLCRRKRFFMDIVLPNGEEVVAHIANTGSMLGLIDAGNEVLLTKNDDPKRTLKYSVQAIKIGCEWVGVNTMLPNRLIKNSFSHACMEDFHHYQTVKTEVKYGIEQRSRIDFLLSESLKDQADCYLEVKNVTLMKNGIAQFPDAVSTRAQKHIDELMFMRSHGFEAALIFLVQRGDCSYFSPASHIDKIYGEKLADAAQKGLIIKALVAKLSETGVLLSHEIDCKI